MMHVNSAICFIKSHFILVKMAIFIFYLLRGKVILIHLSVALPISLPFMDGTQGQEQPLNDSFKLILSLQ